MSVAEAVATATRTVAASKVTPKKMRTSVVYKNQIVILSGVTASPREAATQSKDPCPRQKLCRGISGGLSHVSYCGKIEILRLHPPIRARMGRLRSG